MLNTRTAVSYSKKEIARAELLTLLEEALRTGDLSAFWHAYHNAVYYDVSIRHSVLYRTQAGPVLVTLLSCFKEMLELVPALSSVGVSQASLIQVMITGFSLDASLTVNEQRAVLQKALEKLLITQTVNEQYNAALDSYHCKLFCVKMGLDRAVQYELRKTLYAKTRPGNKDVWFHLHSLHGAILEEHRRVQRAFQAGREDREHLKMKLEKIHGWLSIIENAANGISWKAEDFMGIADEAKKIAKEENDHPSWNDVGIAAVCIAATLLFLALGSFSVAMVLMAVPAGLITGAHIMCAIFLGTFNAMPAVGFASAALGVLGFFGTPPSEIADTAEAVAENIPTGWIQAV